MKLHIKSLIFDSAPEQIYDLTEPEEREALLTRYPHLRWAQASSNDWRVIADHMVSYLNGHHLDAWLSI